jgi:diaminopimelate decarboxylase
MSIEYKENTLYFDGCNTVELAKKYGTPLYVYSESDILSKCKELKESFLTPYENTRVAYACKAFCTLEMCRILEREGFCIDVVSGGELYTAIKAEFPPERIEFNGNNKQPEEIEMAVDYGVGRIIVDGLEELPLIERICKEKGKKVNILYRITPGVENNTHEYITTGKKDSKFGIPLDENVIFPAIEQAIKSEYVNFLGFHFHVGSQLFDNLSHLAALETALKLVKDTKERYNHIVTELNVGGGFGIQYVKGEKRKPFSYFLNPIMKRIEEVSKQNEIPRPAVVIEPGRSLVGEAGITLYTVGSIKEKA